MTKCLLCLLSGRSRFFLLNGMFVFVVWTNSVVADSTVLPWKEGQVVAKTEQGREDPTYHYYAYRVFVKKIAEGYLVQEFYKGSNKQSTAPFILKKLDDVTRLPYGYFTKLDSDLSIDGAFVIYYENGQKMQEGHYVNGKKDGFWSRWHENGQKWAVGVVKLGKMEGLWQLWRKDGSKINDFYFTAGKLETVMSDFVVKQSNGKKLIGDKTLWLEIDDKGHLVSQAILNGDKKEGLWVAWDDKGRKEMLGHYKDDKRDGLWQTFWLDANETKKSEGYYQNGKKKGLWVFWDEQGKKIKEEYYEGGRLKKRRLIYSQ